jgi:hypothetical protein
MDVVTLSATVGFLFLALGFGIVFARLISRDRLNLPSDAADAMFSAARYRVMERLLAEADQKLVASLGNPGAEKKFRRVRTRIFRGYMLQLSEDFGRICRAIHLLMTTSEADRPELAGVMLRQRLQFAAGMMCVELKLLLYSLGWSGVDPSRLIISLDTMRAQLEYLNAVAEPATV